MDLDLKDFKMEEIYKETCWIDIESSYRTHNLAQTLYDYVRETKPKVIVEFGCLYGYSTIAMALALKQNNGGVIYCYDLWEDYAYKHTTQTTTVDNIQKYGVQDYIKLVKGDYYEWLNNPSHFDLLHLDISNDGAVIEKTYDGLVEHIKNGSAILFEGGSVERDNVEWMKKYNKKPIQSVKDYTNYKILNSNFPSISIIQA
tara:strand:- start:740 stop:1342 length:603 start_codon:yes stop_codon:yes gene_type:complete